MSGKEVRKMMELKDTIPLMTSADYKERFAAEYRQLAIRWAKLNKMVTALELGKLDFEPECSAEILKCQLMAMREYMRILEVRAGIEGIALFAEVPSD